MKSINTLVSELAKEIPATETEVLEAYNSGAIKFFDGHEGLKSFMKARENKNSSIDIYQMDDKHFAVDTIMIARNSGRY